MFYLLRIEKNNPISLSKTRFAGTARYSAAFSAIIARIVFKTYRGTMSTQPKSDPELVEVFDTMQESEAMVVHGLLTSAGIESVLANLEAPQDVLPGVGGISVRVNAAQEEEARRLIDDYRDNAAAEDDSSALEDDRTLG
jgi:hypothetical protein